MKSIEIFFTLERRHLLENKVLYIGRSILTVTNKIEDLGVQK